MRSSIGIVLLLSASIAMSSWSAFASDPPRKETRTQACQKTGSLLAADDNTAECLVKCKRAFDSCSNGGQTNIPECIKKRKECYDQCGSGKNST